MSPVPTEPPAPAVSVAAGIVIGLVSSLIQSLGLTIQRKSHVLEEALPEERRRAEHKRPLWLLGFAIFISSNVLGSVFQIAALPVVILAPLGAVSLLWNAVFARILLGDVFTSLMAIGTLLIAAGAVLIAVFGVVQEANHSLEELLELLRRPPFVVYFSLLTFAVLVVIVSTHITEHTLPAIALPSSPKDNDVELPVTSADTTERTPLLPNKIDIAAARASPAPSIVLVNPSLQRKRTLVALSYASLSGILSGMCIIFAKAGVELLLLTIGGKNQFWRWESWVLVGGLVVVALLQLWYLHKSLVLAAPTLVCPLAFCFYNLSSILNGLIYFDQFSQLSSLQIGLVCLGIFVLLSGVGALSAREHGIEIGTWFEGGDALDAAIIDDDDDGVPQADITVTSPGPRDSRTVHFAYPLSPPLLSPRPASSSAPPTTDDDQAEFPHMTMSDTLPDRPSSHSRVPSAPSLGLHGRRRSGLFPEPASVAHPHAQPPSSFGAGGLTIGLSPISPGFALVPRRRVNSVGAKGLGFAAVVRAAMGQRRVSTQSVMLLDDEEGAAAGVSAGASSRTRWTWISSQLDRLRAARSPPPTQPSPGPS